MPKLQVKQFIDSIYKKCGNLTRNQLPLEIVLTHLYDEFDRRAVEMRLTEQNYSLRSEDRPIINQREQEVSIDDFGDPVAVHIVSPDINPSTSHIIPLEIVNFNTLPAYEADGELRVSLYGDPLKIRFSLMMQTYLGWTLKFWYEPDNRTRGINAEVPINPLFLNLITSVVSLDVLPQAEIPDDKRMRIEKRLSDKVGNIDLEGTLENLWYKEVASSKQYGNNVRRPYRAGQSTNARFRR